MPDVVVRDSGIEGKGVFAAKAFKKGEVVIDWSNAKRLSEEEAKQVPLEEQKYLAFCGGKWVFEQAPARFVKGNNMLNLLFLPEFLW